MRKLIAFTSMAALSITQSAPAFALGLSSGSTMRVQVDVYKGPVAQPIEAQLGELSALLAQAVRASNVWNVEAQMLADALGTDAKKGSCSGPKPTNPDCAILFQGLASSAEVVQAICRLHGIPSKISDQDMMDRARRQLGHDGEPALRPNEPDPTTREGVAAIRDKMEDGPLYLEQQAYTKGGRVSSFDGCDSDFRKKWGQSQVPDTIPDGQDKLRLANTQLGSQPENGLIILGHRDYAKRIATISAMMQIEAQRLAGINLTQVSHSRLVRAKLAELGILFGDFAQRISARNSVLFEQLAKCLDDNSIEKCDRASKLPTSDYLRDADPSRYIEAVRWFNANLDSSGTGVYRRDNRIEGMKQLADDYNWEQINDVYASGQGDVGMVFIKDELGNWNLKSFSNDPSELLAAYRKGADAAISAAVKLARTAAGDPTAALDNISRSQRLLDLADTFSGGTKNADVVGGASLSQLRNGTVERLKSLNGRVRTQKSNLENTSDPKLPSIFNAKNAEDKARSDRDTAAANLVTKRDLLAQSRSAAASSGDTSGLEAAVRAEATAAADLVTAEEKLRAATSLHDRRKAELEGLAASAAEAASIILSDHEKALAAISEVSKPSATTFTAASIIPD